MAPQSFVVHNDQTKTSVTKPGDGELYFKQNHQDLQDTTTVAILYDQNDEIDQSLYTGCSQTVQFEADNVKAEKVVFTFSDLLDYQLKTIPGCDQCLQYNESGRKLQLVFKNDFVKLPLLFIIQGDTDQLNEYIRLSVGPMTCKT